MSLLRELQEDAAASKCDLARLLRKCKILAARLGSKPLEEWLTHETNGYSEDNKLPLYRIWPLELKGHFSGPFQSGYKNLPIPEACLPKAARNATSFQCRQSVAGIEDLLKDPNAHTFNVPCSHLAPLLGSEVLHRHTCINVQGVFGRNQLVEVLNTVQNKVLDFVLALEKENPKAGEVAEDTCMDQRTIHQIFNTTITGGVATIVGIANDSVIISGIEAKNLDSLERALRSLGLTVEDVDDLKQALKKDPEPKEPSRFGGCVASWISKMVSKAATGAWNVGVGAAANVLATALQNYYGF